MLFINCRFHKSQISKNGKVPLDINKTLTKNLLKRGDKNECVNYKGIRIYLQNADATYWTKMMLF